MSASLVGDELGCPARLAPRAPSAGAPAEARACPSCEVVPRRGASPAAGSAPALSINISPHTSAPYFVGGASVWARADTTNACPIAMGSGREARRSFQGCTPRASPRPSVYWVHLSKCWGQVVRMYQKIGVRHARVRCTMYAAYICPCMQHTK